MKNNQESGFTLVEILVAISFIAIGMFSIITIFTSLLVTNIADETENIALKIAQKDIEYSRGLNFNQIGIVGAASPDPTGIFTASQLVTSGDSRFAFVGAKHDSKYTINRTVVWIDDPGDATADNDYKRFRTTVSWTSPSPGGNVSLISDFQPTSVTTSLNQAPLIQFIEPQVNNQTFCGTENIEVYAVDPEDLDDMTLSITITNASYPSWAELLTDPADVVTRLSSYDIVFQWNSATVTDDATSYRMLAVAADTSSKLNSTTRTVFTDNQPAAWGSSGPALTASFDGSKVSVTWIPATNTPAFYEQRLARRDVTTSTITRSEYVSSTINSTEDATIEQGHTYEYWIETTNSCGINSDSTSLAGGLSSVTIPASTSYNLDVSFSPVSTGSVDVLYPGSPGACSDSSGCSYSILAGTAVSLEAKPATGFNFSNWTSGPCNGTSTNPCNFVVGIDTVASALFVSLPPPPKDISVTYDSSKGGVQVSYPGNTIICASSPCVNSVPHLTPLTLTATPAGDNVFLTWSTGTPCVGPLTFSTCKFTINADTTTTATFVDNKAPVWIFGYPNLSDINNGGKDIAVNFWANDESAANLYYDIWICEVTSSCLYTENLQVFQTNNTVGNEVYQNIGNPPLNNSKDYRIRLRVCDGTPSSPGNCNPSTGYIELPLSPGSVKP